VILRRKRTPGPPDEDAVVDRALCVSAIAMLGAIAAAVAERTMDEAAAERYLVESRRWLIREGLANALSSDEKALLAKPIAEWSEPELELASRRNEAMGVLLWALAAVEQLPGYDAPFERLPSSVPLLAATTEFRDAARLRSGDELERARAVAELWHWRARTRQLMESGDPRAGDHDLDAIARQAAALATAEGSIPPPIDGDFPVRGTAFAALGPDEFADVAATAAERHYAFNWLAGRAADWDHVPTDT
jgi:hypothetical protein